MRKLGLTSAETRKLRRTLGVSLAQPPETVSVAVSHEEATKIAAVDFRRLPGSPPAHVVIFLTEYKALLPKMMPPVGRYVLCWALWGPGANTASGLGWVTPSVGAASWTVLFINARTGVLQGGFMG